MLGIGQRVMYGVHGVCTVVELENRKVDGKMLEYLVLEPLEKSGSRFLVPSGNPKAMAKLHPLLPKEALEEMLSAQEIWQDVWIPQENLRKLKYRELLSGGDREALLQMVNTLHTHQRLQLEAGRKMHLCDEGFLRDATRLICTEFAISLNIPAAEVPVYIESFRKAK